MTDYSGTINLSVSGRDDQGDTFTATVPIGVSLSSLTLNGSGTVQGTGSIDGTIFATVSLAIGGTYSESYPFSFNNFNFNAPLSEFNVPLGPLGTELGISLTETVSFNATRSVITLVASGPFNTMEDGYHLVGSAYASGSLTTTTSVFSIAPLTPTYGTEWRSQTGSTPFTFTVTRVGDTSAAGSTTWSVSGSGAHPATASDFVGDVLPGGTVYFAPGQTSQTITVNATGGDLATLDDTFTVSVPARESGELLIDSGATTATDTIQNPLDTVVYIQGTLNGVPISASGVLIAPNEVLTAAHVVYSSDTGQTLQDIKVTPAYDIGTDGSQPFGYATGEVAGYNQNFQDPGGVITVGETPYDYALITLSPGFQALGYMSLYSDVQGTNFAGGSVNVTGYPGSAGGSIVNSQESVSVLPANSSVYTGSALGEGSSGGPVWIYGSNSDPEVVGTVSGGIVDTSTGFFTQIGTTAVGQINVWLGQAEGLAADDTSTGQPVGAAGTPYTGPVSGLQEEYINITSDSLNITVSTPNWFVHSGSGEDAIAVSSGTNVLDGGTGSNFLTGGSGTDTFFVDDRGPTADIWSTVNNFHTGDAATIWGVTPQDFNLSWVNGQGATGYTGLTLHATAPGLPTASLTLVGFTSADLTDGRLSVSFGTTPTTGGVPGSTYMYIYANS